MRSHSSTTGSGLNSVRVGDRLGPEQVLRHDRRVAGSGRVADVVHDAVRVQVQHQVRELVRPVVHRVVLGLQVGELRQLGLASHREARGAVAHPVAVVARDLVPDLAEPEQRHDLDELGVHGGAVQALVVVLDDDLPVRLDLVHDPHADPELVELEPLEHHQALGALAHLLAQRPRRIAREVHEDEAGERLDVEPVQREARPVEELVLLDVRGADELAVEVVDPAVVRAGERLADVAGRGLVVEELRPAVAADVVEALELAAERVGDEDGLAGEVPDDVVAGLGQLLGAADADPVAPPDLLALLGPHGLAGVLGAGERRTRSPLLFVVPDGGLADHSGCSFGRGFARPG